LWVCRRALARVRDSTVNDPAWCGVEESMDGARPLGTATRDLAPRRGRTLVVTTLACVAATLVARELVSAYASGALPRAALDLLLPPLASLLLYGSSPKAAMAMAISIAVAACGVAVLGFDTAPAGALDAVLLCTAAIATPIVFDLVLADLGRSLRCDPLDWRTALLTFVAVLAILLSASWRRRQADAHEGSASHALAIDAGGRAG
jgi:hypothetical protein